MMLEGSCRCGTVSFTVDAYAPVPYMRCYCSVCRKVAGSGGYAINLGAYADSLTVQGADALADYQAEIDGVLSPMKRFFCRHCGSALWGSDPRWPELVHPFASAIDTPLPEAPHSEHILLDFKAPWVKIDLRPGDKTFAGYPDQSLEDWHRTNGLYAGR